MLGHRRKLLKRRHHPRQTSFGLDQEGFAAFVFSYQRWTSDLITVMQAREFVNAIAGRSNQGQASSGPVILIDGDKMPTGSSWSPTALWSAPLASVNRYSNAGPH